MSSYSDLKKEYLTPFDFYRKWQSQYRMMTNYEQYEQDSDEISEFDEKYYNWNEVISEFNDAIMFDIEYGSEYYMLYCLEQ